MTMLADEGVSLLGSAVVAAAIAAVVSLVTLAWNARRDRQDRQRRVADAFEACILSREFPFIVRRRNADDLAAERARITLDLSRLQARLDSGKAILRVEAPRTPSSSARLAASRGPTSRRPGRTTPRGGRQRPHRGHGLHRPGAVRRCVPGRSERPPSPSGRAGSARGGEGGRSESYQLGPPSRRVIRTVGVSPPRACDTALKRSCKASDQG
jgi:hypothetical protein